MKRIIAITAAIAALTLCLFGAGCSQGSGSVDNAITVSATGTAQVAPDSASINIVVPGTGDNEEAALQAAERTANDVIARLKTAGVDEADVSTTHGELIPVYNEGYEEVIMDGYWDWDGNWIEEPQYIYYEGGESIASWEIDVTVHVAKMPADQLSTMLKESAAAGAKSFSELVFSVSDREAAYKAALAAAVDAAHSKAEALASASKVYVGGVVNMIEESDASSLVLTVAGDASKLNAADTSTLEAAAKELPVSASVTVSYAIS